MRSRPWIFAVLLAASGCSEGEPGSAAVAIVDSAGVRLVLNRQDDLSEWRVSSEPTLELGSLDGGPEEFFQVAGATRLSDGRIAVLNSGTSEVRFFDDRGTYRSSLGRTGDGPGEFRFPWPLFRLTGDSLAIWDSGLRRLSVFTPTGGYVRSVSATTLNPTPLVVLPDGRIILTSDQFTISEEPGFRTIYTEYWLIGPDGELMAKLPTQPLGEFGRYGATGLVGSPLFGARTWAAGDPSGYWVGTAVHPEVRKYSPAGELELVARWVEKDDRTVTAADADVALRKELLEASGDEAARIRQIHAARPVAEQFPTHGELHVDEVGALWVQRYERPSHDGPSRWHVFDREGVMEATASLPAGNRVLEIGSDYVLTVGTDELGIEYVRAFALERSAGVEQPQ